LKTSTSRPQNLVVTGYTIRRWARAVAAIRHLPTSDSTAFHQSRPSRKTDSACRENLKGRRHQSNPSSDLIRLQIVLTSRDLTTLCISPSNRRHEHFTSCNRANPCEDGRWGVVCGSLRQRSYRAGTSPTQTQLEAGLDLRLGRNILQIEATRIQQNIFQRPPRSLLRRSHSSMGSKRQSPHHAGHHLRTLLERRSRNSLNPLLRRRPPAMGTPLI